VSSLARSTIVALLLPAAFATAASDPFAWLQAAVTIDSAAQSRLNRGEVIVRVLPAVDGEIGVFAAARLDADGETLAAWANAIAQLKKSPYVLMVRRFSEPPSIDDLEGLALDDADLAAVRECRPGSCDLKLAGADIAALRQATLAAGPFWKDAVQSEFKRILLGRLAAYQTGGFASVPPYADRRKAIDAGFAAALLLARSPYLNSSALTGGAVESFFYWSKEQYGAGKPVIGVTHVDIVRPLVPSTLRLAVISREIFASHYRNASLGMTAVTEDDAGSRYLVYINRSHLDVLGGIFGSWKRAMVEGRLKNESATVFNEVRRRLESGAPPE
jgi:hypothetical protein